ncbi:MAG: chorismate lyase, partial [Legionellales bacterium]|nr:chorismate lyase [Legionellales bacterium]
MQPRIANFSNQPLQAKQDFALLWPWLSTDQSLTAKAMRHGVVQVHNLRNQQQLATVAQRRLFNLASRQPLYQREIMLTCDDQPWWLAYTITPFYTTQRTWRLLKHLGNRSLGDILFHDRRVRRAESWIAPITRHQPLPLDLPFTLTDEYIVWSKSTRYWLANHPWGV